MKVLLCEDMDKLGWLGDVVEVKSGYARNYLLPQGIAVLATKSNIKSLAEEKASRVEQRKAESEKLAELASRVDGAEAVIAAKANEQGHLFGSVTARAIADNLRAQGFEVTDGMVAAKPMIWRGSTRSEPSAWPRTGTRGQGTWA